LGQRDLERKFSAEEREVYKGTLSDETEIKKQNPIKKKNPHFERIFYLKNTYL